MKKNPISVAGGRSRSPARAAASKENGEKMGPRTIAAYREGWSAGVQRAAEMVRAQGRSARVHGEHPDMTQIFSVMLDHIADRIAAEPAPSKDGK